MSRRSAVLGWVHWTELLDRRNRSLLALAIPSCLTSTRITPEPHSQQSRCFCNACVSSLCSCVTVRSKVGPSRRLQSLTEWVSLSGFNHFSSQHDLMWWRESLMFIMVVLHHHYVITRFTSNVNCVMFAEVTNGQILVWWFQAVVGDAGLLEE